MMELVRLAILAVLALSAIGAVSGIIVGLAIVIVQDSNETEEIEYGAQ